MSKGLLEKMPFTRLPSDDTMEFPYRPQGNSEFLKRSQYYNRITDLHIDYPHLQSLSLYMEAIERQRVNGQLGSPDSDSILVAEISVSGGVTYDRIDCYNPEDIASHSHVLRGTGNKEEVVNRILIVEDVSPAAIEALGSGFDLDPHIFFFHLGFDTRRSAMAELVDASREKDIPVTWCMPAHSPENFISVPIPCDLKPLASRRCGNVSPDMTYSRQAYRPIAEIPGDSKRPKMVEIERAFYRLSLVFNDMTEINTTIVLAFPTWKRRPSSKKQLFTPPFLDSYNYDFDPRQNASDFLEKNDNIFRRGFWADGQWERVEPLFYSLIYGHSQSISESYNSWPPSKRQSSVRSNALLWLYAITNKNYQMACQAEGRCWRDIRAMLDANKKDLGHVSQRPKRQFRDSMTKTVELLEIAKDWMEDIIHRTVDFKAVGDVEDEKVLLKLRRRVDVTLMYEKARIGQVLLNINDYQSEVEMNLMVAQLEESRYAIRQADSVAQLTRLAFFFVPLSTVCSAFGMNVKEMDKHPTIWWFVVVSAISTFIAIAVSSSAILGLRKIRGEKLKQENKNVKEKDIWG